MRLLKTSAETPGRSEPRTLRWDTRELTRQAIAAHARMLEKAALEEQWSDVRVHLGTCRRLMEEEGL